MRRALVVGVDRYDSEMIMQLRSAVRDARKFAEFFSGELPEERRFETTLLANPTSQDVLAALESIQRELDDESTFVLYFAGHGVCVNRGCGRLFLCRDASRYLLSGSTDCGSVSLGVLNEFSREGRGKMFFCFDASRTSSSERGVASATGTRDVQTVFSSPIPNAGPRFSLSSCGANKPCADDGAFVDALVAEMRATVAAGRDLVLGDEFVSGVTKRLRDLGSRQTPEASGAPFVLIPSVADAATAR